jgi:hypothetical protein
VATRPERRPRDQDRRGGGTMPPCFLLRDWYESGKSDHRDQAFILPYLSNPVSPFHGEPLHPDHITFRLGGHPNPIDLVDRARVFQRIARRYGNESSIHVGFGRVLLNSASACFRRCCPLTRSATEVPDLKKGDKLKKGTTPIKKGMSSAVIGLIPNGPKLVPYVV